MNENFKKLADKINYDYPVSFEQIELANVVLDKKKDIFKLQFTGLNLLPVADLSKFLSHLKNNFEYAMEYDFSFKYVILDVKMIIDYIKWILSSKLDLIRLSKQIHLDDVQVKENEIVITTVSKDSLNILNNTSKEIEKLMIQHGFNKEIKIKILFVNAEDILEKEEKKMAEETKKEYKQQATVKNETVEVKKTNRYILDSIKNTRNAQYKNVSFEGEIFKVQEFVTKNNLTIFSYYITDYEDAMIAKAFVHSGKDKEKYSELKPGVRISISGTKEFDRYAKEDVVLIRKITSLGLANNDSSTDSYSAEKRVEFGIRTRMSAMDGIINPKDLIDRAIKWGHKSLAVADLDSIQSFPDLYNYSKDKDINVIYGASFNTLSKNSKLVYGSITNENLKEATYVIFDIETTGLSPVNDEIIELGAIIVKDGSIVKKYQKFVKPKNPISEFTINLTGITDKMLEDAPSIEEVIKEFHKVLSLGITVAHNANFDISFMNQKFKDNGLESIQKPCIDSLVVARFLEPSKKRFKLGVVAKRFGVSYDDDTAHRADYDAQVLGNVWLKMLSSLKDKEINTVKELESIIDENLYAKQMPKEISIYAKNQKGLKELFALISKASTKTFFSGPRLFIEDLPKSENLIISSSSLNSLLVERMIFGTRDQLHKEIERCDVIEVQPPKNYIHFYDRGITTKSFVEDQIKFIIKTAKKLGKVVIATSDAKYLNLKEKIYHEVYINAKGLKGVRHRLFQYNNKNAVYPLFNFLSTKEMIFEFNFLNDIDLIEEIVIKNSNSIASQFENIEIIRKKLYTPKIKDANEKLTQLVYKTARDKYGEKLPEVVANRITRELDAIIKHGFGVIYWIAHKLVDKSLQDGYLVGSRGSVGSSVVATFANITEVNPLPAHYWCEKCDYFSESSDSSIGYDLPEKECPNDCGILQQDGHNIPFETFLGFEANKVPDIDLNFSGDYQPLIHSEVKKIFGASHSFRAGTIATVAEKTAFGYVKAYAEETGKKFSNTFVEFIARGVKGTKRTTGQHPGGIIVIPGEFSVEDFTPINFPANDANADWKTTHFDFHAIHDNVLKLDLLGHDDPTAIKYLEKLTGIKSTEIPHYDKKVLSLFSSTDALGIKPEDISGEVTGAMGIPEFGTKFVRTMLKNVKVESFADLVSISGLSHGTDVWNGNASNLIKEGFKLSEVIACRDDIMVDLIEYNIEPIIAFEIMELVRKGKGLTEGQEKTMIDHKVPDWYIDSCKKIKYMFPKAHATAYVKMAWRIAWFKIYHPLAYYATYFTTRADVMDINVMSKGKKIIKENIVDFNSRKFAKGEKALSNKEKDLIPIFELTEELYARGFEIKPISIKKSKAFDWIIQDNYLIPPFMSLDGLGESVAKSIEKAREEKAFVSLEDLRKRTQINNTQFKKLTEMNAFDGLDKTNQISFGF